MTKDRPKLGFGFAPKVAIPSFSAETEKMIFCLFSVFQPKVI